MFPELRLAIIAGSIVALMGGAAAWSHSIKHEATAVANAECNEDKLRLANESIGEQYKAETEARKVAEARLKQREIEARDHSAAYQALKAQYDALKATPQPDDSKPFLSATDPYWDRGRKK